MDYENLMQEAKSISADAYAHYSDFPVGACVLYESGKIYSGCNIENVSYGLSLCAERNAISNAIAQGEKTRIKAVAIYSPRQKMCLPCGACRQWLSEFAINPQETLIILESEDSGLSILKLEEIFPYGFKMNK